MKYCLMFVLGLLVFVGCQKKSVEKAKVQLLSYKSAIPYVYSGELDPASAADVEGSAISKAQLLSQDVALQELQAKYDEYAFVFAYAWAKALAEKNQSPVEVSINSQKTSGRKLLSYLKNKALSFRIKFKCNSWKKSRVQVLRKLLVRLFLGKSLQLQTSSIQNSMTRSFNRECKG